MAGLTSMSFRFCSIGRRAHAGADDVEEGQDAGLWNGR